jgi:hypothetical protein
MGFRALMENSERKSGSNVVLALDLISEKSENLFSKSIKILEDASPYLCALKINHHLVLPLGLFEGVEKIVAEEKTVGGQLGRPSGDRFRALPGRGHQRLAEAEDAPDQTNGLPHRPGAGVGTEIARAILLDIAHHHQARGSISVSKPG